MSKRGMSEIVSTLIIVILVIVASAIVFGAVNTVLKQGIGTSESCFGNFDEVTLQGDKTCRDFSENEVQFLVAVGDLDLDGLLVSVSGTSDAKSFTIDGSTSEIVKPYGGSYGSIVNPPNADSGRTYIVDLDALGVTGARSITIAPIIDGNQCDVSDTLSNLGSCDLLA